ncbi:MAG TPA: hypothetical protein VF737_14070 [Gemmatimonadaceae bacterium]
MSRGLRRGICLGAAGLVACGGGTSPPEHVLSPRGLLAVSPTTPDIPATPSEVLDAFNTIYAAGARGFFYSQRWSELEPAPGTIALTDFRNTIHVVTGMGYTPYVGIQVINTTVKETPADLVDTAFDSPAMKARFHALLDSLLPIMAGRVPYLSIGNEVDAYLNATSGWAAYTDFFNDAVAYVHQKAPGMKVGVTVEWASAAGASAANIRTLTTNADLDVFTYYAVGPDFHVAAPSEGPATLDAMVVFASGKPVVVQEFGMPTDSTLGSSQQAQADFVSMSIDEFAKIGRDRMPMLSFFSLYDFPQSLCDQLPTYYGVSGQIVPAFEAYLCSLGLKTGQGADKLAWPAFKAATAANGFP